MRVYQVDGRVTVDCVARMVRGREGEIHLRKKTFQVLEVLIDHRDRAISKDELLQTIWEGAAVTDDVLVTSITEIRRALGDNSRSSRLIKTIHGMGYRWIAPVEEIAVAKPNARKPPRVLWKVLMLGTVLLGLVSVIVLAVRSSRGPTEHQSEVAWWRFDEASGDAVVDSSGHRNFGRIVSGVERIPGRMGGALRFNGAVDGIAGRAGASIPMGNSARTITAWIRTDSTNGDFTNLLHYGLNQPPRASFVLALTPDGRVRSGNGFEAGFVTGKSRIDDGRWHALAAVYEGPQSPVERIYLDGAEDVSAKLNATPETVNGGAWMIGKFLAGGTRFRGDLDDVRVFDRALYPAEVEALYRCSSRIEDLHGESGAYYFLPVFGGSARVSDGEVVNSGLDVAGIQLAQVGGACEVASLRGAAMAQDVYLSVDLKTAASPEGLQTEGGVYFRSRRAHAGDGIMGGTSAGYSVFVNSNGRVTV